MTTLLGLALVLAAGAAVLVQILLLLRARRRAGAALPALPGSLGGVLAAGGRHLVMFTSRTCAACRAQEQAVEEVRARRGGISVADVRADEVSARAFGILGTPTAVLPENGRVISTHHGPQTVRSLEELLGGIATDFSLS